ncbi:uncharacterized protein LOC121779227 [Salvia splendens]|uniref:uncharacterized protein LOC121779227 n=1 Tax=Salvia splendens TaxID=180675 RepID=UPI001C25CCBB|nr:uncharacterized protein LOC121779227 [Salvia splendens]
MRRAGSLQAPPRSRPDPDPPYDATAGWRRGAMDQRPVYTTTVTTSTQPPLGFAGPSTNRGPQRSAPLGMTPWAPPGYGGPPIRSSQPSAWDYPAYRQESRHGEQHTAWDLPSGERELRQYSEPMRHDQQRYERPRYEKMKPPRFNGSEAVNWISRVQYYFNHMRTPEEHRLHYVVMMFEGPASEWIFNYRDNNPNANWADFLEDVRRRFDPQCFQNFIGLIAKLCQTGSLAEYNATFETMLNRVRGVPEYILLPIYVEGLTQPVKNQVRLQHPASVAAAMALAVECDSCIDRPPPAGGSQRRSGGRYEPRQTGQPQQLTLPSNQQPQVTRPPQQKFLEFSKLPVIRLSQAEKAERSRLGLCWWCPEKWVAGHNCRGRFLVYMGADGDSEDESEEDEVPQDSQIIAADISHIYALEGRQKADAIDVIGSVGSMEVRILVNTCSSHDFLHPRVAEHLALPLHKVRPFRVYVGNGESLLCSWVSKQTRIVIQKHVFLVDLHILPVHGPDIILGRAWLKSLRRVTNDFDTDTLEFVRNGEHIRLKLVPPMAQHVSLRQFATLLTLQGVGEVFELVHLPHQQPHDEAAADPPSFPEDLPEEILAILRSHIGVFGVPSGMPPKRIFDHRIHLLPQTKPVNVRPCRYPYFQKTEIERQVKEMLDSGIIRPSQSPFSSPVLLIRKKDGSFRFDYRALNAATVPDNFPIPTTDELFDELGAARFFSKLDLRSGYHQIRMCEGDVYKTAFRTHDGHFEFLVMPFGLTNAPSTFQAAMNALFRPFLRQFVIVFFDDILIYSPTLPAHVRHLNEVLSILRANQFFVKLSKCTFACTTVEYLGHIIADGHLKADSTKIDAMMSCPVPTTVKQLRGFLGLTGYYRRFVEHYVSIAGPLTDLLKKDAFVWSPTAATSFEALKAAMSSAPVLRLPDFARTFYLETDASDFGIGAVLLQDGHPLAFFSKKLGPKRRVSSTYHKELYAIVEAVQKWRQYLLGREFVIRSDQKSLKELLQQIIQTPDQQFYVRKLMGYKFRIEYKTGVSNRVADALSRRDVEETPGPHAMPADLALTDDPGDAAGLLMAISSPVPDLLAVLRSEVQSSADLIALQEAWKLGTADPGVSMSDGLLYFKRRIYVSRDSTVKELLLHEYHASPTAGHPGVDRTFKRLATGFYWKGMRKEVKNFVNACYECQTTKYSTQKPAGLLQPLPIPSRVWEDVSMDFITGLPQSRGYTAILVAVDRLTK